MERSSRNGWPEVYEEVEGQSLVWLESKAQAKRTSSGRRDAAKLQAAAGEGDLEAMLKLAKRLHRNPAASRRGDLAAAVRWYRKAAAGGLPAAQNQMGRLQLSGQLSEFGLPKDASAAAEWFRRAGHAGCTQAQVNLAILLERGLGVPQDLAAAVHLLTDAACSQDMQALNILGTMHHLGHGVLQNAGRAAFLYQAAAAKGSTAAMANLAACYEEGMGAPADMEKALALYRRAASLGSVQAQNRLGLLGFQQGRYREAEAMFRAAAEAGDRDARSNLQKMGELGVLETLAQGPDGANTPGGLSLAPPPPALQGQGGGTGPQAAAEGGAIGCQEGGRGIQDEELSDGMPHAARAASQSCSRSSSSTCRPPPSQRSSAVLDHGILDHSGQEATAAFASLQHFCSVEGPGNGPVGSSGGGGGCGVAENEGVQDLMCIEPEGQDHSLQETGFQLQEGCSDDGDEDSDALEEELGLQRASATMRAALASASAADCSSIQDQYPDESSSHLAAADAIGSSGEKTRQPQQPLVLFPNGPPLPPTPSPVPASSFLPALPNADLQHPSLDSRPNTAPGKQLPDVRPESAPADSSKKAGGALSRAFASFLSAGGSKSWRRSQRRSDMLDRINQASKASHKSLEAEIAGYQERCRESEETVAMLTEVMSKMWVRVKDLEDQVRALGAEPVLHEDVKLAVISGFTPEQLGLKVDEFRGLFKRSEEPQPAGESGRGCAHPTACRDSIPDAPQHDAASLEQQDSSDLR